MDDVAVILISLTQRNVYYRVVVVECWCLKVVDKYE